MGGFLVWLVPFAVSCTLIGQDGKKTVSEEHFRTIMLLVGSTTASWATYKCAPQTLREGVAAAGVWLAVN